MFERNSSRNMRYVIMIMFVLLLPNLIVVLSENTFERVGALKDPQCRSMALGPDVVEKTPGDCPSLEDAKSSTEKLRAITCKLSGIHCLPYKLPFLESKLCFMFKMPMGTSDTRESVHGEDGDGLLAVKDVADSAFLEANEDLTPQHKLRFRRIETNEEFKKIFSKNPMTTELVAKILNGLGIPTELGLELGTCTKDGVFLTLAELAHFGHRAGQKDTGPLGTCFYLKDMWKLLPSNALYSKVLNKVRSVMPSQHKETVPETKPKSDPVTPEVVPDPTQKWVNQPPPPKFTCVDGGLGEVAMSQEWLDWNKQNKEYKKQNKKKRQQSPTINSLAISSPAPAPPAELNDPMALRMLLREGENALDFIQNIPKTPQALTGFIDQWLKHLGMYCLSFDVQFTRDETNTITGGDVGIIHSWQAHVPNLMWMFGGPIDIPKPSPEPFLFSFGFHKKEDCASSHGPLEAIKCMRPTFDSLNFGEISKELKEKWMQLTGRLNKAIDAPSLIPFEYKPNEYALTSSIRNQWANARQKLNQNGESEGLRNTGRCNSCGQIMSRILGKSFGILKEMSHSKRIPRTIESTLQEGGEVIDKDTITEMIQIEENMYSVTPARMMFQMNRIGDDDMKFESCLITQPPEEDKDDWFMPCNCELNTKQFITNKIKAIEGSGMCDDSEVHYPDKCRSEGDENCLSMIGRDGANCATGFDAVITSCSTPRSMNPFGKSANEQCAFECNRIEPIKTCRTDDECDGTVRCLPYLCTRDKSSVCNEKCKAEGGCDFYRGSENNFEYFEHLYMYSKRKMKEKLEEKLYPDRDGKFGACESDANKPCSSHEDCGEEDLCESRINCKGEGDEENCDYFDIGKAEDDAKQVGESCEDASECITGMCGSPSEEMGKRCYLVLSCNEAKMIPIRGGNWGFGYGFDTTLTDRMMRRLQDLPREPKMENVLDPRATIETYRALTDPTDLDPTKRKNGIVTKGQYLVREIIKESSKRLIFQAKKGPQNAWQRVGRSICYDYMARNSCENAGDQKGIPLDPKVLFTDDVIASHICFQDPEKCKALEKGHL